MPKCGEPITGLTIKLLPMSQDKPGAKGKSEAARPIERSEEDPSGIVQCKGYRCWAKKGVDAKWRDLHGTLLEVVHVVAEF